MDWDNVWYGIGAVLVLGAAALIGTIALATKNVDYYYVSAQNSNEPSVTCSYAHWTWHVDEKAYCSDDINKVLDFTAKANSTLRK